VGKSDHWYDQSGKPHHGAHLKEARANGYLPSVTTILGQCWPKTGLDKWKQEQVILACLTTPRLPHEPDDAYISRILACADAESAIARDTGTRRHDLIEQHNKGNGIMGENADLPFIMPYIEWMEQEVASTVQAETPVVHLDLGYAGKLDLLCNLKNDSLAVVDIKNRKKLTTYPEDCIQLSAYSQAVGGCDWCVSVILGSLEPGILVKYWSRAEVDSAWEDFKCALALWKRSRNYWPEKFYQGAAA
jgi:hypothetical protein